MRRIVLYPLMLFVNIVLVISSIIMLDDNGGLASQMGFFIISGAIILVDLLIFLIYEPLHHNLDQILLLKLNSIYKRIVFVAILTNVVWLFLLILLKGVPSFSRLFGFVFIFITPYFLVLWLIHVHKKIIARDVYKGHNFNIFITLLVVASIVFCIIMNAQFLQDANFKAMRFERILKTTFAENNLDECVRLRKNKEICVRYFAINKKDPNICEEYINYISAESLRMNYIVSQVNNFIDNCKISVEE